MSQNLIICAYVFDIDGTLTIVGERLGCLQQDRKNWAEFYARCGEDRENPPIASLCRNLIRSGCCVWLLTGRTDHVRPQTVAWLTRHGIEGYGGLLMRPAGDHRPDTEVKPELLTQAGIAPIILFEDRASMVDLWRAKGFTCAQVAKGDF